MTRCPSSTSCSRARTTDGIRYDRAVALLGYTDASLLDEIVDAFAAGDGAAVFRAVNRVIEGGHEPRRFATDLLDRFRDLIVLASVPDAISSGLLDVPPDRVDALKAPGRAATDSPRSPAPPRSSPPGSTRCAAPPRRGCCLS